MENWADEEIKGKILHKLTRLGKFKHSHTSIDNLPKGFPPEIRRRVKEMAKELKKEGILFSKPTHYGEEVSIDATNKDKIIYYVKELDRKLHTSVWSCSLSIQSTSACYKPHTLVCGGTSCF